MSVPLSALTTLGVGGPARRVVDCPDDAALCAALETAAKDGLPTFVLGGGSNLLVADAGYDGVVIRVTNTAVGALPMGDRVRIQVGAGVRWDDLVALSVQRGDAGLECLSGIPGNVGAAPIQNVGAYGQEVSETIDEVIALDRATGATRRFTNDACGFGYRTSHFKGDWLDRYVVTGVSFVLRPSGPPTLRYGQLQARFDGTPTLAQVRETVLDIRRAKSMVYDPSDPNHRSAGSFFMNPVIATADVSAVLKHVSDLGLDPDQLPQYPAGEGATKLSAAWLIERSGFDRGFTKGAAGLSTNHCLALVNNGAATAADLVALARTVRQGVRAKMGVTLWPEPRFIGFEQSVEELLA